MSTPRRQLIEWIEQGLIQEERVDTALTILNIAPDGKRWRTFVDHLLLWLGGLALVFAVMFFIAYNWKDLGRFSKFGMVEAVIVLAVFAYCKFAKDSIAGKVSILVATISLGVLLALYGQTYQTGADSWQLFFNWALLMLPWAIVGRFSVIWVVWISLINVSIVLYYQTFSGMFGLVFSSESAMLWVIFLFNSLALIAWQLLATKWQWLSEQWAIRLLAVGSGVPLTCLVILSIFSHQEVVGYPGLVWGFWLGAMYYIYRRVKLDLFMLAGCCLSTITITVSFLSNNIFHHNEAGAYLLLALIVIGMGSGATLWLKNIHREALS